jgi:hypothetical protein
LPSHWGAVRINIDFAAAGFAVSHAAVRFGDRASFANALNCDFF